MLRRCITVFLVFILLSIGFAGCKDSGSGGTSSQSGADVSSLSQQAESVSIVLPGMPFQDTDAVKVDQTLITSLAQAYCNQAGEKASSPAFFLGYLPLAAADALGGAGLNADTVARHLGSLAVSGFFGGVWLRDALLNTQTAQALSASGMSTLPLESQDTGETTELTPVFSVFSALAGSATSTALNGSDAMVLIAGRASIEPFLILYGYNWGYFNYILMNPPAGATVPAGYDAVCRRFLDCVLPCVDLATLTRYQENLAHLYPAECTTDANAKWREMRASMNVWGLGAVNAGDMVWQLIMNDRMSPDVYELLLDLSARFMLVAELCLLPAMQGYAENDPAATRVAILEQAGMVIWAGAYFMGLLSDVPTGTFPELIQGG